ncbi:CheR family methyltransferase [Spirosoma gilvum]
MSEQSTTPLPTEGPAAHPALVVGLGASAGGVEALMAFFEQVPPQSGLAYIVILHLSPDFDSQLAPILQNVTPLPIHQVTQTVKVEPDHVYVISPNGHLVMEDGHLTVLPNTTQEERRAPVDIFFRTLADSHGARAVAVILSGTGADGSMGLKRVKENGGAVFVQSPHQAAFPEMPRQAIATDLTDEVLPVDQIPGKLITYRQRLGQVAIPLEADERPQEQQQALREVFTQLRLRTGHDFSNYKRPTLLRRIERRITVRELADLPAYADYLLRHPDEADALLKDLLISVTNFFRDEAVFTHLEEKVLPAILEKKTAEDSLRIWVPGCATGEEAYSLAMLAVERTQGILEAPKIQIFGTDIDEEAINQAREGLYTLNDAADVSPSRLRRFFTPEGDRYRISREIREMVLFARHNVLKDPPFSRMDLVSCRNLLIYFNYTAQERVLETFHFALHPGAYLLLGLSETTDSTKDLYATLNREHHLYQSRMVMGRRYPVAESVAPAFSSPKPAVPPPVEAENRPTARLNVSDLHQRLREQSAPTSILVNEEYDILHFTQGAERYFHFSGNEISRNLLKLIRPELRLELRTAFYQAFQQQTHVEVQGLSLAVGEQTQLLTLQVRPVLEEGDPARGYFLVLFENTGQTPGELPSGGASAQPVARQLEEELIRVKTQLQTTTHQHELQAEALKASNEELQAMNEELRSAAEELETSKEELQSINEELTTVNQELKVKIDEVSLSSDNLRNLINSTNIATLFLDRSLRVNLFTPITQDLFNLLPSDYGRPLTDITHRLTYDHLVEDAHQVLTSLQVQEREVATTDGRVYLLRILPYRTASDRINGLVLTFVDITRRQAAEAALKESDRRKDEFLALLAHELRNPMATLSNALLVLETTGGTDEQLPLAEVLPMMSREVGYLARLVDDLLDISRINLGKLELHRQRLELGLLVQHVQTAVLPLVEGAHQQLRVAVAPEPLYVDGDSVRLMQVLRNLLGNAIKFTPAGGLIELHLERVGGEARLRVVDTGIGLVEADLARIFTLFAQVDDSHTQMQGGLGMGLTLVRAIVSAHWGRVEAHSKGLGQGSEFVIYLPLEGEARTA